MNDKEFIKKYCRNCGIIKDTAAAPDMEEAQEVNEEG